MRLPTLSAPAVLAWISIALAWILGMVPAASAQGAELSEAARWLQGYLRIDTSNPPGGERPAAEYLAALLHREGIASRLLVNAEGRASLWARLAAGDAPATAGTLVLLHHIDVVPPGPGWTAAPFAGEVEDERLWGRGAVDAKSLGIAQLAALVELAREGGIRHRDVLFLAVADEESGGELGSAWLLEHHPELFAGVEAVLNEGGTNRVIAGDLAWWGIEVAQKRPLWLEVEARGRGGHGSGFHPWSATHKLLRALHGLLEMPPRWQVSEPVRRYLAALAPLHGGEVAKTFLDLDAAIAPDGPRRRLLPGMSNLFLDSVQVTVIEASDRINVVPERARAEVDVRLLPTTDADDFLGRVREALGDHAQARVLLDAPPAPASPTDSLLYRILEQTLGREAPVVPAFIGGFTDSRYFRQRGIPAYGVSPFSVAAEDLRGIHGPDERIPLGDFERGVERTIEVVRAWVTTPLPEAGDASAPPLER